MAYIVNQPMGNGKVHIYWVINHRVEDKATPVQSRQYLGLLDEAAMELVLGLNTPEPDAEILEKLKIKGIGYSSRRSEGRHPARPLPSAPDFTQCVVYDCGKVLLLRQLALESGLLDCLAGAFGMEAANGILALAIFECDGGKAFYRAEDWLENTVVEYDGLSLSAASISRLCAAIGKDSGRRDTFFTSWYDKSGKPKSLVNDTTSISSYAQKLSQCEFGHNRDLEHLPEINLTMVYAREIELPLFYRTLFGSISDVATIVTTATILLALKISNFTFALDRGFFSGANLFYFHDHQISFTIGVPLAHSIEGAAVVERVWDKLNSFKSCVQCDGSTLFHVKTIFNLRDRPKRWLRSLALTAHVYLDKEKRAVEEKELITLLNAVLGSFASQSFDELKKASSWLENLVGKNNVKLFFIKKVPTKGSLPERSTVSKDGQWVIFVSEREYKVRLRHLGVFMILNSDEKMDGLATLRDNRSRDCQEKIFDILKNNTGNDRLRNFLDDTTEGRVFIAFVAVILYKTIEIRLRKADILKKITVNKALDLAAKIRNLRMPDGSLVQLEIPKKTRDMLAAVAPSLLPPVAKPAAAAPKKPPQPETVLKAQPTATPPAKP